MLIKILKDLISAAKQSNTLTPLQIEQYHVQLRWLEKERVPDLETIIFSKGIVAPEPGRSYFGMLTGIQHPFSRGSIHISSANPFQPPKINLNYLGNDFGRRPVL
ncbi:hypothetical protein CPB84DRAFT_1797366 [Gymnopilus junonius]|uniref:Uncharacterized protein n=1 Tax=Gymnopilus junonius TaxID=109634 RepID=A0A9P5TFI2_GYMJU|nr:hypothetical protein CPB84DRAFT_1797366 [Gymnopilus junonius]